MNGGLQCRVHAVPRLNDGAHDDASNFHAVNSRSCDCFRDGDGTEFRHRHGFEGVIERPNRVTNGIAQNHIMVVYFDFLCWFFPCQAADRRFMMGGRLRVEK